METVRSTRTETVVETNVSPLELHQQHLEKDWHNKVFRETILPPGFQNLCWSWGVETNSLFGNVTNLLEKGVRTSTVYLEPVTIAGQPLKKSIPARNVWEKIFQNFSVCCTHANGHWLFHAASRKWEDAFLPLIIYFARTAAILPSF